MAPTADPMSGLLGALLTGGLIGFLVIFAIASIAFYISYRIIRSGVRDGMVDAIKKTGLDSAGADRVISGYPPAQTSVGPPPAPVTEYSGYRGPNG